MLHKLRVMSVLIVTVVILWSPLFAPARASMLVGNPDQTRCTIALSRSPSEQSVAGESGFYSDGTLPARVQAYSGSQWSDAAYLDLTNEETIPPDAVVKNVQISYGLSSGSFAMPYLAIFDEDGKCFYVNRWSRRTDALNGLPVRQRWRVQFWSETIWAGPARIWPRVTITYSYEH